MQVKIKNKVELQLINWKNKAVERGRALRAEKKRSSSLILSRAQHKEKWKQERDKRLCVEAELKEETMPTNACQFFYECENCKTVLKPKKGDCCVYCSYGTVACPPIQEGQNCCS